jgi:hypothetical protein
MNDTTRKILGVVGLCAVASLFGHAQAGTQSRLAIPSYVSPISPEWGKWEALGPHIAGIMILNRNNGDDTRAEPAWAAAVKRTQASGIVVLGYIRTGYAHRNPDDIRAKIDGVYSSYGVDGIFLDETPTDCSAIGPSGVANLAYYRALANYIKGKPGGHVVVLNPGVMPADNCWMSVADVLVTFEKATLAAYQTSYVDAPWTHAYTPDRFWNLVYSVPTAAEMHRVVELAHRRGVGWLYVTDDGPDGNPWDNPATYLTAEAKDWTGIEPTLPLQPHKVSIQCGTKGPSGQMQSTRFGQLLQSADVR